MVTSPVRTAGSLSAHSGVSSIYGNCAHKRDGIVAYEVTCIFKPNMKLVGPPSSKMKYLSHAMMMSLQFHPSKWWIGELGRII